MSVRSDLATVESIPPWEALRDAVRAVPPLLDAVAGAEPTAATGNLPAALDLVIAAIDAAVSDLVDRVLHGGAFQRLESAWRGLRYVVDQVAFHENTEITIWSCSKEALAADFEEAAEVARSRLFFHAHTEQIGQFGGKPYAAILADMDFGASPRDVRLLRSVAAVAASTHAPFFHAVAPSLLKLESFRDLPRVQEVPALFQGAGSLEWSLFRDTPDSRCVGALMGRPLHRTPYTANEADSSFGYTETIAADGAGLLWGGPVYVFATRLAASFARYRTLSAIVGDGEDSCPAPARMTFESLGPRHARPALDTSVTPRLERALREVGVTALMHRAGAPWIYVSSANSLQAPKSFPSTSGGREAALSYLLGTRFPYFLFACRIAHYAKVIERELIGSHRSAESIESRINEWLSRFVINQDAASPALRAQYPLRLAQARVRTTPETPDWYEAEVMLRPHLKYLNSRLSLTVVDQLRR
jgi:type VI secretion system protein ImpC